MPAQKILSNANLPDPNQIFPNEYKTSCFVKNVVKAPNVQIGDYTYYDDSVAPTDFEKNNILFNYPEFGEKLIIGKFCQIASGTKFIMGPANHRLCSVTTYPFNVFGGAFTENTPDHVSQLPHKGDTVVGNDVWFGRESVIMPGVKIGDGAIIAAYSVVAKDVEPYTLVGGNPAHFIKKRFNDELTELLLKLKWWDFQGKKLAEILPLLCDPDLQKVANEIKRILDGQQN
jgi:virginiamycin A acetyltransferase